MTRTTNARLAGFTYVFYIAVGITQMVVSRRASAGEGIAAKLASIAAHAPQVRIDLLLGVLTYFTALALAVALYGITRDEDHELAVLALACRVAEGVLGVIPTLGSLGLLWLATADGPGAPDTASATALAALLLQARGWNLPIGGTFFAVGSTLFSCLLLRGRMIPVPLAWLGVVGSALLVVGLPLQLAAVIESPVTLWMWLPVAVFELTLGPWLLMKGVPPLRTKLPHGAFGSFPSAFS